MKKERHILGKGFVYRSDNKIGLYNKRLRSIILKFPLQRIWCYCQKNCNCKPWKLVIER